MMVRSKIYINEEQMDVDNLDENYDNWEDIEFEDGNMIFILKLLFLYVPKSSYLNSLISS